MSNQDLDLDDLIKDGTAVEVYFSNDREFRAIEEEGMTIVRVIVKNGRPVWDVSTSISEVSSNAEEDREWSEYYSQYTEGPARSVKKEAEKGMEAYESHYAVSISYYAIPNDIYYDEGEDEDEGDDD